MRSLLLVADTRERLTELQKLLGDAYTLFIAESQGDALECLQLTKVDVVVGAFETRSSEIVQFFEQAKVMQPNCVTLYLAPPLPPDSVGSEVFVPQSDFSIRHPFSGDELRLTVNRLSRSNSSLKGSPPTGNRAVSNPPRCLSSPQGNSPSHGSGKFCAISPKRSARISTWSAR